MGNKSNIIKNKKGRKIQGVHDGEQQKTTENTESIEIKNQF